MTVYQIQADIRLMDRFICERIPPDRTRIVLADGPDGPAWVDLTPLWDGDACDLIIETNEPDAFGRRDVYEHFRRMEMTGWKWERELTAEMNRWKVHDLESEITVLRKQAIQAATEVHESADGVSTVDEWGLPREVSTLQAARILGVCKDTVLKLKSAGLLEYRNTGSPDSCRPVFAFPLRSVIELRTSYDRDSPVPRQRPDPPRRRVKGERKYKHLNLDD